MFWVCVANSKQPADDAYFEPETIPNLGESRCSSERENGDRHWKNTWSMVQIFHVFRVFQVGKWVFHLTSWQMVLFLSLPWRSLDVVTGPCGSKSALIQELIEDDPICRYAADMQMLLWLQMLKLSKCPTGCVFSRNSKCYIYTYIQILYV